MVTISRMPVIHLQFADYELIINVAVQYKLINTISIFYRAVILTAKFNVPIILSYKPV